MIINIHNQAYCDNSKEVTANTIFVYTDLTETFIPDALRRGCQGVIPAEDLARKIDVSSIKLIGITGTNGKTTTAAAIYSYLLDLGFNVALQGTRGFFINDNQIEPYSLTTPVQLATLHHISQAVDLHCQFFVMEVSSHAIVQKRMAGLDFSLKVLTNITRDHLDYHNSLEEYIQVKNSFFNDESPKLINKDDKNARYNSKNTLTYSLDNPSTYKVQAYSFNDGMDVVLSHFGDLYSYRSELAGLFNIYNITAAIGAVHMVTDFSLDQICQVIEGFAGVSGRMEKVSSNPLVMVDFAHTPDGMQEVLKSFSTKDIIVVFGAGGNRDRDKRPLMGRVAFEYANKIIVTSDNPRFEDPDSIVKDIIQGMPSLDNVEVELNRKEAIKKALTYATSNSVVLILGKGDEEEQIIYDKAFPFNDKKVVMHCLNHSD